MADTFAPFLDWLAGHMDDHDIRGSNLAATLYVVQAVAATYLVAARRAEPSLRAGPSYDRARTCP